MNKTLVMLSLLVLAFVPIVSAEPDSNNAAIQTYCYEYLTTFDYYNTVNNYTIDLKESQITQWDSITLAFVGSVYSPVWAVIVCTISD